MEWYDLCFLHWKVEAEALQAWIPPGLQLDLFQGSAWLALVPFAMRGVKPKGLPGRVPGVTEFLEFNVRTYVRDREVQGVWFFSLDAAQWLAVRLARRLFYLPYFDARMSALWRSGWCHYHTRRVHPGQPPLYFDGSFSPQGPVFASERGSLEEWLTERYWLFSQAPSGQVYRGRVWHPRWPLQRGRCQLGGFDLETPLGFRLPANPDHLLFSPSILVEADLLQPAAEFPRLRS